MTKLILLAYPYEIKSEDELDDAEIVEDVDIENSQTRLTLVSGGQRVLQNDTCVTVHRLSTDGLPYGVSLNRDGSMTPLPQPPAGGWNPPPPPGVPL